ncbi:hypothetical protein E1B28_011686 [Marasmius oreades]|uniref:Uncharacterized protein n=1 Tax=Marasmius oreades TaxID=181124 RepID=A0A9P7RUK8_9AGAR|nr:uncharacterized protein E1B28_011686 [Marasmius oreades]KAG7090069.1 hypothetical protein E1B28_011686 [Marasmius oreades]
MAILRVLNDIFKRFCTLLLSVITLFKHIQFSKPRRSRALTAADAVIPFDCPLPAVDLERGEISPVPKAEFSIYSTRSGEQERVIFWAPLPESDGHLSSVILEPSNCSTPKFPFGRASYSIHTQSRDSHASSTSTQTMPSFSSRLGLMDSSRAMPVALSEDHLGKIAWKAPQFPIPVQTTYRDTLASNSAAFYHGQAPRAFFESSSNNSLSSKLSSRKRVRDYSHRGTTPTFPRTTCRSLSIRSSISAYSNLTDSSHSFASNSSASPSVYAASFPRPPNFITPTIRSPHRHVVMNPGRNGTITPPSRLAHVATHRKRSPIVWYKDLSILLTDSASTLHSGSPGGPKALPAWLCVGTGSQFSSHIGHFRYPYQQQSRPPSSLTSMKKAMLRLNYHFPPSPSPGSPQSGTFAGAHDAKTGVVMSDIDLDVVSVVRSVMQETREDEELDLARSLASGETTNSLKVMAVLDEVEDVDSASTQSFQRARKVMPSFTDTSCYSIDSPRSRSNSKTPSGPHSSEPYVSTAADSFDDTFRPDTPPSVMSCSSTAYLPYLLSDLSTISGKVSDGNFGSLVSLSPASSRSAPTRWGRFSYPSTSHAKRNTIGDVRMSGVVSWSDLVTFSSHTTREGSFNVGAGERDCEVAGGSEADDQALGKEVGNIEKEKRPFVRGHVRAAMRIEKSFKALDRDIHWSDVVNLDRL